MATSKTWPGGATNVTAASYSIPDSGEVNWAALNTFLQALADGAQCTTFQKFAIRQATTTPVTVATTDCVVTTKLAVAGAVAVNLPAGANKQVFIIYDETGDAATNTVTITPDGTETIEGAANTTLTTNKESVILIYDSSATDWKVAGRLKPGLTAGDLGGLTASRALVSDVSGNVAVATTTSAEIGYVNGVTSAIQTQLDNKQPLDADLTALAASASTGLSTRTASDTWTFRTITAGSTKISITNGNGVSGNPTIDAAEANFDLANIGGSLDLTSQVTGALPIANGGTGQTAKTAAFDALAPGTTKGDVLVFDGTNHVRLAVGTNGQFLEADSTQSTGLKWGSATAVPVASSTVTGTITTYVPVCVDRDHNPGDANYTITDTDGYDIINMATTLTANRTITLPTASDNDGRYITVRKSDSSNFSVILDGEGAETIDGQATIMLPKRYSYVTVFCDGSSWHITSMDLGGLSSTQFYYGSTQSILFGLSGSGVEKGLITYNHTTDTMSFATDATTAMTINDSQYVGVGISDANTIFEVEPGGSAQRFNVTTGVSPGGGNVIGSNVEPNASGNNEFLAIESGYSFGFNLGGDGKLSIFNNSAASAGDVVYDSDLPGTYANLRLDSSSNVEVVGALSKGSGSFRIKHPLINKKSTHHLVHSFIEGPYCDLIYRGRVNLVNGRAEIDLDSHFKMTNGTLRRLLTNRISMTSNESGFTPVKSSVAIVDLATVLTIESQDPASTDRISWMVIGERDDDHIKATNWTDENGRPILEPDQEDPNKPK